MAIDFENPLGVDFACVDDLDANLSLVEGRTALAQSTARRIITPRGGLYYDPNYGTDIRGRLHRPFPAALTARLVEQEALKDERVENAGASVEFVEVPLASDKTDGDLIVTINLLDVTNTAFDLTSQISPSGTITVDEINEQF